MILIILEHRMNHSGSTIDEKCGPNGRFPFKSFKRDSCVFCAMNNCMLLVNCNRLKLNYAFCTTAQHENSLSKQFVRMLHVPQENGYKGLNFFFPLSFLKINQLKLDISTYWIFFEPCHLFLKAFASLLRVCSANKLSSIWGTIWWHLLVVSPVSSLLWRNQDQGPCDDVFYTSYSLN